MYFLPISWGIIHISPIKKGHGLKVINEFLFINIQTFKGEKNGATHILTIV